MSAGYKRGIDGRIRAWVRVTSKRDEFNALRTHRFAAGVSLADVRTWRETTRTALEQELDAHRRRRAEATGVLVSHGFRYDAMHRYLPAVQAMPTYAWRVKDIDRWVEEFGDRDSDAIHAYEIRAVRDRWLTDGPKRVLKKVNGVRQWVDTKAPLAASTVNHRLRALSNFYTVVYPHQPNPVHDVPEADEPKALPRAVAYDTIRTILDAMADRGRPVKKGEKRPTESLAKVRARVMAWAGVEATEMQRIPERDWRDALETGVLVVAGRRKGTGGEPRLVPLTDEAVSAIRDLVRLEAYGTFRARGVLRAWQIACVKVVGRPLRIKDLRHSFVTGIVAATKNLHTAQLLAGHNDPRTTQRYALAALLPMLRAGVEAAFPTPPASSDKEPTS